MTDLKNLDEAALQARLRAAAKDYIESLERRAGELCEEVAQAARALRSIEMRAPDLLMAAAWAASAEVEWDFAPRSIDAHIGAHGRDFRIGPYGEALVVLPAGKYRALLFLVPIRPEDRG